jgi:hypothetical protein
MARPKRRSQVFSRAHRGPIRTFPTTDLVVRGAAHEHPRIPLPNHTSKPVSGGNYSTGGVTAVFIDSFQIVVVMFKVDEGYSR